MHKARSFTALPGPHQAQALLVDIATAACAFTPVAADAPLALYGAGDLGRLAREFLNTIGHDAVMVVDRNAHRLAQEAEWSGVRLVQPGEITEAVKDEVRLAVSIVTSPYVPVEQSLGELGFIDVVPFYDLAESFRHRHPLSNGWFAPPLSQEDREYTARILSRWDDDVSRAHHLQFLAWRRLREEWSFEPAPLSNGTRYFIPEVMEVMSDDEILLDGGAYHGGVIKNFIQQTNGAYRQIIAIEPDPANRAHLACTINCDERAAIYDCALAENEVEAPFHDGLGYASQLSETGRMRVATRAIDTMGHAPTFVKLHLEGAELAALKGARQTLVSYRPIVAATVYHNADGIWRTPLWLMETLHRYRFLFRAHSWCGTGAVVYGIPEERCAP